MIPNRVFHDSCKCVAFWRITRIFPLPSPYAIMSMVSVCGFKSAPKKPGAHRERQSSYTYRCFGSNNPSSYPANTYASHMKALDVAQWRGFALLQPPSLTIKPQRYKRPDTSSRFFFLFEHRISLFIYLLNST